MRPYNRPSTSNPTSRICRVQSLLNIFSTLRWSCHAKTTSASQLEANLQTASAELFPENRDIAVQPSRQVADSDPRKCPRRYQPKRGSWSGFDTHVRGYPVPRSDCCGRWTHPRTQSTLRLSTECYVKKSSVAVCWRSSHSQNCIRRGWSSGDR